VSCYNKVVDLSLEEPCDFHCEKQLVHSISWFFNFADAPQLKEDTDTVSLRRIVAKLGRSKDVIQLSLQQSILLRAIENPTFALLVDLRLSDSDLEPLTFAGAIENIGRVCKNAESLFADYAGFLRRYVSRPMQFRNFMERAISHGKPVSAKLMDTISISKDQLQDPGLWMAFISNEMRQFLENQFSIDEVIAEFGPTKRTTIGEIQVGFRSIMRDYHGIIQKSRGLLNE